MTKYQNVDDETFDFVIIGSGFGGSVSAMRLSEKGYSVLVLERGKRFEAEDFPKTNWNVFDYLWMPALRCSCSLSSLDVVLDEHDISVSK